MISRNLNLNWNRQSVLTALSLILILAAPGTSSQNNQSLKQQRQQRIQKLNLDVSNPLLFSDIQEKSIIKLVHATNMDGPIDDKVFDVELGISVRLGQVFYIDEANNVLASRLTTKMTWYDPRVAMIWPEEYNTTKRLSSIKQLRIPKEHMWVPRVPIRNGVQSTEASKFQILSEGRVIARPGGRMILWQLMLAFTACNVNVLNYPYDYQTCRIIYNGFDGPEFSNLSIIDAKKETAKFFVENSEWEVVSVTAKLEKDNAVITVVVKRHITEALFYLVLPGMMITLMSFTQFFLPPTSGERTGLGITCMLSMVVFMTIFQEKFSPDEHRVPRLAIYFALLSILITLMTASSVLVIAIDSRKDRVQQKPPSKRVRRAMKYASLPICHTSERRRRKSVSKTPRPSIGLLDRNNSYAVDSLRTEKQLTEPEEDRNEEWVELAEIIDKYCLLIQFIVFIIVSFIYLFPPKPIHGHSY